MQRRTTLRQDAEAILIQAIGENLPGPAVERALKDFTAPAGKLILIAIGKAAWTMAKTASEVLGDLIGSGLVITKYHHVKAPIPGIECLEAGHPVLDENSLAATRRAEELVSGLTADDCVLFLVSGGGSALFEDPKVDLTTLADINRQLLASGASIQEMNCVRKHLSNVKGGRFAQTCAPARVLAIALSDVLGDALDTIASGPTYPDATTSADALSICDNYQIRLTDEARAALSEETPKSLDNAEIQVIGSVRQLTRAAAQAAAGLGYEPHILTCAATGEAREVGALLGQIAAEHATDTSDTCYLIGGETVVHITGDGFGGRNQELALAAVEPIAGIENVCVASVGSDGTDGPTDAAGAIVDGHTCEILESKNIKAADYIAASDSYHAHEAAGTLIVTGPTGTNVNDVAIALIRAHKG
jgi:hydroxypyruvate reductase